VTVDEPLSLKRLLRPQSVAIVGISPEPASIGGAVLANLERFEYRGEVHLVSRKQHSIAGRSSVGSIDELPAGIDTAVLCIPAAGVTGALKSCAARGIGAAVIYAAGFAEIGAEGRAAQKNMARQAREAGILVNGPNCIGFVNFCDGVPLTYEPLAPLVLKGLPLVGVLAQSGAMASSLRNAFLQKQIGISHVISTGNEATLGLEDFMAFLVVDGRATAIVIFAEQIRRPRKFLEIAREAKRRGKHVVMLHPGRSVRARASAASHTGALAGDHAIMAALVEQSGVVLVDTTEELIDTAEMLARFPVPSPQGAAVVTNSGAFKGFALDFCEAIGLELAAEHQDELRGIIGLESGAYAPGRYNDFLHHPAIHGGELCASYTYGLNSPLSPETNRRENWWYYSQSGPGIYQGDVHFYSNDWDAREDVRRIDTAKCRVALLTGEYDYSCTPAMTATVAQTIAGAHFTVMTGMGHFPMVENYPEFRRYLLPELERMLA
jgi:acetate---CoA ligase (ADP-forming)